MQALLNMSDHSEVSATRRVRFSANTLEEVKLVQKIADEDLDRVFYSREELRAMKYHSHLWAKKLSECPSYRCPLVISDRLC